MFLEIKKRRKLWALVHLPFSPAAQTTQSIPTIHRDWRAEGFQIPHLCGRIWGKPGKSSHQLKSHGNSEVSVELNPKLASTVWARETFTRKTSHALGCKPKCSGRDCLKHKRFIPSRMALLTVPEGQPLGCIIGHAEENQGAAGSCVGDVLG